MYHVLYKNSAGKNTMSKCQRTDGFTRKLRALLYCVNTTTDNIINCNHPRILIRFNTQRHFRASLSIRASDSGHPVTHTRKFCMDNTGHRIYHCMTAHSKRNNMPLHACPAHACETNSSLLQNNNASSIMSTTIKLCQTKKSIESVSCALQK